MRYCSRHVSASLVSSQAQAVSYRDLKSVKYGKCLYAYSDPLEDIYLTSCSQTPAKYGNWAVTNAGYYNNHPLWILRREGGTCLGVDGTAADNYLFSSCRPTGSRNVWEVFTTQGRYVLKSFGTYQTWRQHKCLTFATGYARLGACNLTSTGDQIYR